MIKKILIFFSGLAFTLIGGVALFRALSPTPFYNAGEPLVVEKVDAAVATPLAVSFEPLTIESIFSDSEVLDDPHSSVIMATGDIIPARVTDNKIRRLGVNFPFEHIPGLFSSGDITITNLEAPLIASCPHHTEGMVFCGQPLFAQAMSDAGISIATLENNHILNHGLQGKKETISHLLDANIESVTFDEPLITTVNDMRLGIFAINAVGPQVNKPLVAEKLNALKKMVDVVVVSVHWGKEYTYFPQRAAGIAPDDPIDLGHFFVDNGADFVMGNHPHWVQSVEQYKQGFIAYAHGNFIFDQEWSRETKEGVIGKYVFNNKKLVDVAYVPIIIEKYGQVRLAQGVESTKILDSMKQSSIDILK